MSLRTRLALPLLLAPALLALAGCGHGDDDAATTSACRGLSVIESSLDGVESSLVDDSYQPSDAQHFSDAIAEAGRLVSAAGVSDDLVEPVAALTKAYGVDRQFVESGNSGAAGDVVADNHAWAQVVAACKPYADISST